MPARIPGPLLALTGAVIALALTGCQDPPAGEQEADRSPSVQPKLAAQAPAPAFQVKDILLGKAYDGPKSFQLASSHAIPKADRFWLLCEGLAEPVLVTSSGESDRDDCCPPGGGAQGRRDCVEPDRCATMSVVHSLVALDCESHFVMAVPASFAKPKAWMLDLARRRYKLACPPDHHDEPLQNAPPSAPDKRLAKAWPELSGNPHLITSLSCNDRPPVHLVHGTTQTGQDTYSAWGFLAKGQLTRGGMTVMPDSKSTPQWHMLAHGCGIPFYSVPSPVLGFELGKSGARHLLFAEQLPTDRVRFSVWAVASTGLKMVHEFGLPVPDPKFE